MPSPSTPSELLSVMLSLLLGTGSRATWDDARSLAQKATHVQPRLSRSPGHAARSTTRSTARAVCPMCNIMLIKCCPEIHRHNCTKCHKRIKTDPVTFSSLPCSPPGSLLFPTSHLMSRLGVGGEYGTRRAARRKR